MGTLTTLRAEAVHTTFPNLTNTKRWSSTSLPFVEVWFCVMLVDSQEQLRSAGHECSGSHADPRAIKTHAPLAAVKGAICRAAAAKVSVFLWRVVL